MATTDFLDLHRIKTAALNDTQRRLELVTQWLPAEEASAMPAAPGVLRRSVRRTSKNLQAIEERLAEQGQPIPTYADKPWPPMENATLDQDQCYQDGCLHKLRVGESRFCREHETRMPR